MSTTDFQRFRTALVTLRSRLTGDVSHLKEETLRERAGTQGMSMSAPADVADQGSDLYEYEFNLSLLHNQEQTLAEIRDALERMDNGTYGKCEECQESIARPRLQALPYTRYCVACARKLQ
jgi:RNA polymerase-binding protein DksA